MIGAKIERAWPVNPKEPDWRGELGQTLHEALLEAAAADSWPTESDRAAIASQARSGHYQGVRLLSPRRGWVAVWHPALTAYLAEQGLASAHVRDLHHVLHGLVAAGLLQPRAEARSVPGIGQQWHYILKAEA